MGHDARRVMGAQQREGNHQQVHGHQHVHHALPAAKAPPGGDQDEHPGGDGDSHVAAHPEVAKSQAHADELGDDGQQVEHQQIRHREAAPQPAEALEDQPSVSDAGYRAEADHHLLVHEQHRGQRHHHPQQAQAIVLAGLGEHGQAARVGVGGHHHQPRPHDREKRERPASQRAARTGIGRGHSPQGPHDVAEMSAVEREAPVGRRAEGRAGGGHDG
jgi:hypothetical protein